MMKFALLLGILSLLLLQIACTPAPPIQEDQGKELAKVEGDFDPLAQDRDRPVVVAETGQASEQPEISREDQQIPEGQESLLSPVPLGVSQGYRVQIFLSDNLREAAQVLAEARGKFEEEVYLEYDAPYYKVRVGDCKTELEGQDLLKAAHRRGYRDAWLVRTVISESEE
jgi:hypothetical protein